MAETERLRRSKRNKFFLDVSALNSANPERRRTQPVASQASSPAPEATNGRRAFSNSPGPSVANSESPTPTPPSQPEEEICKRPRRPTRNTNFVYGDDSDDEEDAKTGMNGPHACTRCPCRFETRPGLANHTKLHFAISGERRKYTCDFCDFSCGSAKAIRNHKRCHAMKVREELESLSDTENAQAPPELTPVQSLPLQRTPTFSDPPQLAAAVSRPTSAANSAKSSLSGAGGKRRNKCTECPFESRNRRRLEIHSHNHNRKTGWQCHRCSLTTPSSGFLKRHITEIHKETKFPWPPKYIENGEERSSPKPPSSTSSPRCVTPRFKLGRAMVLRRYGLQDDDCIRCPSSGCAFFCHTSAQMASHKFKAHNVQFSLQGRFRCVQCGLFFRSRGSLLTHRHARHSPRRVAHKVKSLLIQESVGRSFLRVVYEELVLKLNLNLNGENPVADGDAQPTRPVTPAIVETNTITPNNCQEICPSESQSPITANGTPSPPSDPGFEMPEYLRSIKFDPTELAAELQKNLAAPFRCNECPFGSNARGRLDRHMDRHTVKSDLKCPQCSFSCRGEDIMASHVRLHVAVEQKRRSEEEKITVLVPTIPVINGTLHTPPIKLKTKQLRRKTQMIYTPVVMTDGVKYRRCLECPYVTKHSCDLNTHYQMHFSPPQRYNCSQCSYSTKRAICLKQHYQTHREQNANESLVRIVPLKVNGVSVGKKMGVGKWRIYCCSTCPFVSRTLVKLWQHARHHIFRRGALLRCSECSFHGLTMDQLDDHILMHTSDNVTAERVTQPRRRTATKIASNDPKHKCPECPYIAPIYQQLWNHRQKHKRQSKFQCPHCSFSIGSEYPFKLHVESHVPATNGRPAIPVNHSSPQLPVLVKEEDIDEDVKTSLSAPLTMKRNASYPEMARNHRETCDDAEVEPPKLQLPICMEECEKIAMQNFLPPKLVSALEQENNEAKVDDRSKCSECPFIDPDPLVMILHRECHTGKQRPMKCDLCTYSCLSPESLHAHISLHMPNINLEEAASERRKQVQRQRYQQKEVIPPGAPHYSCSKCSFRCLTRDSFAEHMMGHAQDSQRRLLTAIKRNAQQTEECRKIKVPRRTVRKTDKHFTCALCSFMCETPSSFSRHTEMHSLNGLYQCRLCSYSANTHSITLFHEMNHHVDQPMTNLCKAAILAPEAIQIDVSIVADDEKIQQLAGMIYTCQRCPEFKCIEKITLTEHWRQMHYETDEDKSIADRLSLGIFPINSVITAPGC